MKLGFLRQLYDDYGGYVSVYLDATRANEEAAQAIEPRWRSARKRLAADGADRATLDAVQDVLTDPANATAGMAVFARHGTVAMRAPLRAAPRRQVARLSALPHVMPMLAQRPPRVPHLLVTASRAGGQILAVTGTGRVLDQWRGRASSQHGPEDGCDSNARDLAAHSAAAAAEVHAEHIILAGDPWTRAAVLDHLNPKLREITAVVDAEVAADSAALAEAAEKITTDHSERTSVSRFGTWHSRMADGTAVAGLAATIAALADGRAAEAFICGDHLTALAWTGPAGSELALTADFLTGRGVTSPARDRADAAIARAVACTDAELFFVPGDAGSPEEGIGATLRY